MAVFPVSFGWDSSVVIHVLKEPLLWSGVSTVSII
jgi:hypothetical protein